jgi:hypothetical protein
MGLNYFYNSSSEEPNINIASRTMNYGNISYNYENYKEKYLLKTNSRKKSCDSNISNISDIFQKTLDTHNQKKDKIKQNSNSNISTTSTNFSFSDSNNLRKSYYHRLIHKNLEVMNKSTIKNNTIFIFDWDDTLFFTTHINPSENNTFFYESQSEKKFMNRIEFYVSEILNKALSKGEVLIITNSGDGWVNACTKFYYPNLIPILKKIKIISARDLYQKEYPNDPTTWKIKAFNDLKKRFKFEKCIVSNIICIGDNNGEIIAAQKLGAEFDNCLVKTIKFKEKPNLKELIKQIILINQQILRVCNYPKSLTIQVNTMKNPKK